jgi:hypothetical protein
MDVFESWNVSDIHDFLHVLRSVAGIGICRLQHFIIVVQLDDNGAMVAVTIMSRRRIKFTHKQEYHGRLRKPSRHARHQVAPWSRREARDQRLWDQSLADLLLPKTLTIVCSLSRNQSIATMNSNPSGIPVVPKMVL